MTIQTSNNIFASLTVSLNYFYKSGDLRLPLYTLKYPRFVEIMGVHLIQDGEHTTLRANQYKVDGDMLIIQIPVLEDEIISWSFYAN